MKYTTPEIEMVEFEVIDIIRTSSDTENPKEEGPTLDDDMTPVG